MKYKYGKDIKLKAQSLRKNMTKEERKLWYDFLRDLPLRVKRQKEIGNYVLDFYCSSLKIAIEIDGSQHFEDSGIEYDKNRTEFLNDLGIRVLRYDNGQINNDFESVCTDILREMNIE